MASALKSSKATSTTTRPPTARQRQQKTLFAAHSNALLAEDRSTRANININAEQPLAGLTDHRLLSHEEFYALHERAVPTREIIADKEAFDTLFVHNLKLVAKLAARAAQRQQKADNILSAEDLFSEGVFGLHRALLRFDRRKGFEFSTYATWWIRQAISRAVDDHGDMLRVPVYRQTAIRRYRGAEAHLLAELKRYPTAEELAAYLALSVAEVDELREDDLRQQQPVSLDIPTQSDSLRQHGHRDSASGKQRTSKLHPLADILAADTAGEAGSDEQIGALDGRTLLDAAIRHAGLNVKEAFTLVHRYGLFGHAEDSLDVVGKQLHVSRERVRQIQVSALAKLKAGAERAKHEETNGGGVVVEVAAS